MHTLENGKITTSTGVTLSLKDVVTQLNKSEVLMGELTEALASIPHPSPKHDNYFDYESEYSGHWQSYDESTSYGRGNW